MNCFVVLLFLSVNKALLNLVDIITPVAFTELIARVKRTAVYYSNDLGHGTKDAY